MLRVPVGFAGTITVQVGTKVYKFPNILLEFGRAQLKHRGTPFGRVIQLGSGRHDNPSPSITDLAQLQHSRNTGVTAVKLLTVTETTATHLVEFTATFPKGRTYNLRELGLVSHSGSSPPTGTLATYALVRDSSGGLSEIPVAVEDELKVTYSVQLTIPLSLPPVTVEVGTGTSKELIEVTFVHDPEHLPSTLNNWWYNMAYLATGTNLGGSTLRAATGATLDERRGNGTWASYGNAKVGADSGIGYIFNFEPPLRKTDTQTLQLLPEWDFQNVDAIEVP